MYEPVQGELWDISKEEQEKIQRLWEARARYLRYQFYLTST